MKRNTGTMEINRRNFVKNITTFSICTSAYPLLTSFTCNENTELSETKIDSIELFRYDIDIPRYFSFGTWHNRQHLFMKISSGKYYGWSEIPAKVNTPNFQAEKWVKYLRNFKGKTINEAQKLISSEQVPGTTLSFKQLEFIEMGLLDLMGRILNQPSINLLNLNQRKPVPGLFCILDKDIEKVRKQAYSSIEQNLAHHMKFKMYGEQELDIKLLKAVREILGKEAVVISDVNKGYKKWGSLNELASVLIKMKENGLNAIEDPAHLETHEWIQLQKMIGKLSLIPDAPMRPAWKGLEDLKPGMGRIVNLHPSTMGSFKHTALLANKVRSIGADIMIGDDSLVGPACSAWQQIAIGSGAVWVEAIEKKEDSKNYLDCILDSSTKKDDKGYFSLTPAPGFGLTLDTKRLKKICKLYIRI